MNLIETRQAIEDVYLQKLIEVYDSNDDDKKESRAVMICHDYLQTGGALINGSPFIDIVACNPQKTTNDWLDFRNLYISYFAAYIRNKDLTLEDLRKVIINDTDAAIEFGHSWKPDEMISFLLKYVQCGGVLEELNHTEKYEKVIEKIKDSRYKNFLYGIVAKSKKNAEDREKEKEASK